MALKNRYIIGLEKLEFAASQVSVMKDELIALQPKLVETSTETEKLMEKIAQDTVEVEAKKEVSGVRFKHVFNTSWEIKEVIGVGDESEHILHTLEENWFRFRLVIGPSISFYKDFIPESLHKKNSWYLL